MAHRDHGHAETRGNHVRVPAAPLTTPSANARFFQFDESRKVSTLFISL